MHCKFLPVLPVVVLELSSMLGTVQFPNIIPPLIITPSLSAYWDSETDPFARSVTNLSDLSKIDTINGYILAWLNIGF